MELSFYKKILSLLMPVLVRKTGTAQNNLLELYYYRGRYQLATHDALYSDGKYYTPLKLGFAHIKKQLPGINNVLVLGTGLGSAPQVMTRMGYAPDFTLVEYDETILQWAIELMPSYAGKIDPVCADARQYMEKNEKRYDLLVIDIFIGRAVPPFVTTAEFMGWCRNALNKDGRLVFNYIIQQKEEWHRVDAMLRSVFPQCYCIDNGINRIIIATA